MRVRADRAVDGDVLVGDRVGGGARGVGPRAGRQRRRGAPTTSSSAQRRFTAVGRVASSAARAPSSAPSDAIGAHRQPDPVGRRRADQRRAPHLHRRDRVRDLGERAQRPHDERVGQGGLIDDLDDDRDPP